MNEKDKKVIRNFFNAYNSIINAKLNNGDYKLNLVGIYIRINDRYDVRLIPYSYIGDTGTIGISINRYTDVTGYARKYEIYSSYVLSCSENNNMWNLYSLYYNKSNDIYTTINIPEKNTFLAATLFNNITTDIRIEKINELL